MEVFIPGAMYYHGDEIQVKTKLQKRNLSDDIINMIILSNHRLCAASKMLIEKALEEQGQLYRSKSQMVECFLKGETELFVSLRLTNPEPVITSHHYFEFYACGMQTCFRYGYEKIRINLWLRRIWQECRLLGMIVKRIEDVEFFRIKELDILGTATWDKRKKEIDLIPLIVTGITAFPSDDLE